MSLQRNVKLAAATAAALILSGTAPLLLQGTPVLAVHSQCSDGLDNDNDGSVDYPEDSDCESLDDEFEGAGPSGIFVAITDGKDTVEPGGDLIYVITLRQQRDAVRDVDVDFHLPHQANVTSSSEGGYVTDRIVRWNNISVERNVTKRLQVHMHVSPKASEGHLLIARVRAEGDEATDTTYVSGIKVSTSQKYNVQISDSQQYASGGDTLHYTVRVRNLQDTEDFTDIRVSLPQHTSLIGTVALAQLNTRHILWPKVHFSEQEERIFRFSIRLDERIEPFTHLRTRVSVEGGIESDDTTIISGLEPNSLSVKITDNLQTVRIGELVTYTVTVENASAKVATEANINASLPIYSEFVSVTEGGRWDGRTIRWHLLQIAPKGSRTLQWTMRVRADAPLGTVLRSEVEADSSRDVDTTEVGIKTLALGGKEMGKPHRPDRKAVRPVFFSKTADRTEVLAGGIVHYTITVQNTLPHAVRAVIVSDRYDASSFALADAGAAQGMEHGMLQWSLPTLEPGETWEVRYALRAKATLEHGSMLRNIATISGPDIRALSLEERVTVATSGVMGELPAAGAPIDALLSIVAAVCAGVPALLQRRFLAVAV
jgi:uncharacterized repeat protein (TIGR01451 family)